MQLRESFLLCCFFSVDIGGLCLFLAQVFLIFPFPLFSLRCCSLLSTPLLFSGKVSFLSTFLVEFDLKICSCFYDNRKGSFAEQDGESTRPMVSGPESNARTAEEEERVPLWQTLFERAEP